MDRGGGALNPGPEVSTAAAAALTETAEDVTEGVLGDLVRAHLVEPAPVWGRWRLHDLIRLYAGEQGVRHAEEDGREAALVRLLDYCRVRTRAADTHVTFRVGASPDPCFPDRDAALTWLETERPNLLAALLEARAEHPHASMEIAFSIAPFLQLRRYLDDWTTAASTAVQAARAIKDPRSESRALTILGSVLYAANEFEESISVYTQALTISREVGDRQRQGMILDHIGSTLLMLDELDNATSALISARSIHQETGNLHGEAVNLGNLGKILHELGKDTESTQALTMAVDIFHEIGDHYGESTALAYLGLVLGSTGEDDEALQALSTGAEMSHVIGDQRGEALALGALGTILFKIERYGESGRAFSSAATLFQRMGDVDAESNALQGVRNAVLGARLAKGELDAVWSDDPVPPTEE